ncbi:hypothetical protein VT06_13370 [Arsukibacterium sp. MJ3]|nr:hypothetical protein VT06_13370 [Arsukibacterium sp. MJ3]
MTLPLSFMQDFKPERRLLSLLLQFVKASGVGDKSEISEATGIPTGDSSGKVEPIIYYAIGMGLITASKEYGVWELKLTLLGNQILNEDPFLSECVSLWILHLMLCRPLSAEDLVSSDSGVVDPWFTLFSLSEIRLGTSFTASDYSIFIEERYGASASRKRMSKVILGSYEEDSCLGLTKAITLNSSMNYFRSKAPQEVEFFPVYAAYMFLLWDEFFAGQKQSSLNEFFSRTRMLTVMHWTDKEMRHWLNWMSDSEMIQLDSQTGESIALRTASTADVINLIYSELI